VIEQGDIISYLDMCREEGVNLQRGMNYRLRGGASVILMSIRPGAPYADRIEEHGRVLIYEGHDVPHTPGGPHPKSVDQPAWTPAGTPTQNGLFFAAAAAYKGGAAPAEVVKVYEKIRSGIWVYNGLFQLVDAWHETSNARLVFKFRLEVLEAAAPGTGVSDSSSVDHSRVIPASVKLLVWQRDKGRCVVCGREDNLHFDHIIPYSKGGSSLVAENIQLMCARHNLGKRDKIE
jgi:hypothetical protein